MSKVEKRMRREMVELTLHGVAKFKFFKEKNTASAHCMHQHCPKDMCRARACLASQGGC